MKPKAIVFDFGGVLIDWNPRYLFDQFFPGNHQATQSFLDEIGFDAWNRQFDKGIPFETGIMAMIKRFPVYREQLEAYNTRWEETVGGPILPSIKILRELYQAGFPLYGLSNWSAEKFALVRPKYEFFNWFKAIILSGEVNQVKPDPEIFLTLLRTIGYQASHCLFVDDAPANIAAARELGFDTIHFLSPHQLGTAFRDKGFDQLKFVPD